VASFTTASRLEIYDAASQILDAALVESAGKRTEAFYAQVADRLRSDH
jgi:hypothetical protein